ncbi:DUF4124 domain-containing protein [Chitinibacter fontanus]|uniref:DUF4124 domain-containing protein n=1 Tax=Chitinibacter fontanus TaxID=1737446 RepID=A0A7D5Z6J9_9NEIS|nr:DUF4124 domain-containing protein [Chitinibacter fontanus]QLI82941.1 DUF4124 domain-containing protein [Chitinibacter fontanus]
MRLTSGLLIAAACLTLTAHAEVFKWVDASGRVVYSDQPPPAGVAKAKKVNVKDTAVTNVASPKKADASAASGSDTAAKSQPQASPAATKAPARDEAACSEAQKRLSFLQNAKLYKQINDKGSVEFLEAEKKKQEMAEKQAFLEKNCK